MAQLFPSRGFRRTRERASGLLFALGVDDLSSTLPTGQALSLVRATTRTIIDSTGRVSTIAHSQYPWSAVYNSEASVWEPTLDLQAASANLCLRSEDFGSGWSSIGTPTRTAGAWTCGDLTLDLLGDDAAGTLEGYSRTVSLTGNTQKGVSVFMKAGTSTTTVVRLRDTSASATRCQITIAWSSGVPTVTATTGTDVGTLALAGGVYRFRFQSNSAIATNTNQIEIYPASNAALATTQTGTVYVGGVQVEDFGTPTAYIKSLASAGSRDKDILTAPIAFAPQTLTVYCRTVNYAGINAPMFYLGGGGGAGVGYVTRFSGLLRIALTDGSNVTRTVDVPMPSTSVLEFVAQFNDLTTAPTARIDTGSGFSASTTAGAGFASWYLNSLWIGTGSVPPTNDTSSLNSGLRRLIIAPGARTLAEMRGLNV